jgi:hypothetical protein
MFSGVGVGVGTAVGGALLALWILVRYPDLGLRSLRTSVVICVAAALVCDSAHTLIPFVVAAANPMVALLAVAVPMFVLAFWSAGILMKAFMAALPGR